MRPEAPRPSSEINVTPLLDVLLVLLIVSMLLALAQHAMMLQLPVPAADDGRTPAPLVLQVRPGAVYAIDHEPVPVDSLASRIRRAFAGRPESMRYVNGDPRVRYQEVITAMDVARGAGVRVLAVTPR